MPNATNILKFNPVIVICATACLIVAGIGMFWLIAQYPDQAEVYLRPLIPSLVTLGAAAVLYLRAHLNNEDTKAGIEKARETAVIVAGKAQNAVNDAKETAITVAEKAETAVKDAQIAVVESNERLNGELDQRIEDAITRALINTNTSLTKKDEE